MEITARERPAEYLGPRRAIAEEVQRRSGLLELRPEDRGRDEEDADRVQPPTLRRRPVAAEKQPGEEGDHDQQQSVAGGVGDLLRGDRQHAGVHAEGERTRGDERETAGDLRARSQLRRRFGRFRRRRMKARVAEVLPAGDVLHDAADHADAGRAEPDVPVDPLPEVSAHERRDEGAEVDAHVVDREAGVAARVVRSVQAAHDHRGVAFQETGADDDQRQPDVERRQRLDGHAEVAARDDDAAVQDGAALTDQAVGDPAARQAGHVDHRRVEPVHRAGDARFPPEAAGCDRRRHEEDQQRAHAVIAEALPHLGQKERGQPARMTKPLFVGGGSHFRHRSAVYREQRR